MAVVTQKRSSWIFPLILVLLAGAFTAWFFTTHKRVTEEDKLTISREARSNSYFAAQLFLEKMGLEAETQKGREVLLNLPSADDAIIVKDIGYSFNEERIETMKAWLNQGGHIITFANQYYDADDEDEDSNLSSVRGNRLLDNLGVYIQNMSNASAVNSTETEEIERADNEVEDVDSVGKESIVDVENTPIDRRGENCEAFNTCDMVEGSLTGGMTDTSENVDFIKKASDKEKNDKDDAEDVPKTFKEVVEAFREMQQAQEVTFHLSGKDVTVHMDDGKGLWLSHALNVISEQRAMHSSGIDQIYMADIGFENGGRLTVLTHDEFMRNPLPEITEDDIAGSFQELLNEQTTGLDSVDNAYLLWHLVKDDKKVWLLPRIDAPSLTQLLWQRARYAVISFSVLLLAWLLWQFGRFGPIREQVFRSRRNILEHLGMIGDFSWRIDKAEQLFQYNRDVVKQACIHKHPQLAGKLGSDFSDLLSERIDMDSLEIQKALFSTWQNETSFIEYTHLLQRLREKL